jgi:hypothetical protein
METEYGGGPVDGGTYPALIFSRVIDAYDSIQASRNEGDEVEASTDEIDSAVTGAPAATETESSGAVESAPPTESAPAPTEDSSAADAPAEAPAGGDAGSDAGTAPAAPSSGSAGGVSPG